MKTLRQDIMSKLSDSISTGDIYTAMIIRGEESPHVRMSRMYFAPGSRTAWHTHTCGEYLYVLEGTTITQERDGDTSILRAGSGAFISPNTEHWQGAYPTSFARLLAIWGAPVSDDDSASETEWGSQVTDEEVAALFRDSE